MLYDVFPSPLLCSPISFAPDATAELLLEMPMEAEAIEVRNLAAVVFCCLPEQSVLRRDHPRHSDVAGHENCMFNCVFREVFLTAREAGWDLRFSSLRTQQGSNRRRQLGHGLRFRHSRHP
jgi:hypothetical protein